MLKLICLLLAVAFTPVEVNGSTVVGNRYVDALMEGFPEFARQLNLEPMSLPSAKIGFSKKVLLVKVRGSLSYSGSLRGLSTLHRSGDFLAGHSGTRGFIDGTSLAFSNLKASYSGSAKFMGISVSVGISASISSIRMRIRVSCEVASGAVANLDNFSINSMSSIGISVSGLGPLGWILGAVLSGVAKALKSKIISAIEGPIRGALNGQVKKISFPKF